MPGDAVEFSDELLIQTAADSGNDGRDADLPAKLRFLSGVAKAVLARVIAEPAEDAPALFVCDAPSDLLDPNNRVYLLNKGRVDLGGRAWLTNMESSSGFYLDLSNDPEEMLAYADGHPDLRTKPTVLYVPGDDEQIIFFPNGLADESTRLTRSIQLSQVSPAAAREAVAHYHEQTLLTPRTAYGSVKVWAKASDFKSVPRVENVLQGYVRAALIGRFPTAWVFEEGDSSAGRWDLLIGARPDRTGPTLGVIELKVLREGHPVDPPIDDGIDQAYGYGQTTSSAWAQLFCFDMRNVDPDDDVFAPHRTKASRLAVELAKWFMFSSSRSYRRHLVASAP